MINAMVWRQVAEQQRRPLLESQLLVVEGRLGAESSVRHLIAKRLLDPDTAVQKSGCAQSGFSLSWTRDL